MREEDIRPASLFNQYLSLVAADVQRYFADKSTFVDTPCPACTSSDCAAAFVKEACQYSECNACGTLFLSPRPRPEQLDAYYQQGEAVRFWSTDFFRHTAEARRERMFRPRAALVADIVARSDLEVGRHAFADVGSGYGVFLEEVSNLSIFETVVGIEPAPPLAQVCRDKGFAVLPETVETVAEDSQFRFDFVSAFEVLEHVFAPDDFLSAILHILRPGGILLLTTLTVSGFDIQVLWDESKSVHPPMHINLLSLDGMSKLFSRCGFETVEICTPGELDLDIVANTLAERPDLDVPRFVRSLVQAGAEARANFQAFLKQNLLSSHIRVVARRPLSDRA